MASPSKHKFTGKQQAFIDAYMTNGFNATQAALTAGYSEDTAHSIGHENLRKPDIANELKRLMRDYVMPAEEVLSRLTDQARGDLGDIWDEGTGLIDWKKARALGKTALIKRIKHKTTRVSREDGTDVETFEDEVELHNPQVALQLLGKQHALFTERLKIELTWQDETVQLIKAGKLTYADALETFDHDDTLVRSLFAKAEIPISVGEDQG